MKTLLLLAGHSTRFWPLKDKHLFPLCGKTILHHQVDCLRAGGQRDIILVVGRHNKEQVSALFPTFPIVEQKNPALGMLGALLSALPLCDAGPVLVVGGSDAIEPEGYRLLRRAVEQRTVDGAILARRVDRYFPGGYLSLQGLKSRNITAIIEKPGEGNEPGTLVNIVAHIHKNPTKLLTTLRSISQQKNDGYGYEQALNLLFGKLRYLAVPYNGRWHPLKYPWHLLELLPTLLTTLKRSIHHSADVHPTAVIDGNVTIERGVRVFPHATICGPAYIGEGTIVAHNALVRTSSIGTRCVVGFGTEVKSSVLSHHVWTHMSYIGDSVVGENVSFGAGCVTGNLRLDEEDIFSVVEGKRVNTFLRKFGNIFGDGCRLGVQVNTNPGVKVGEGVFVDSKAVLSEDIPHKSFVTSQRDISVRRNVCPPPTPEKREAFRCFLRGKR